MVNTYDPEELARLNLPKSRHPVLYERRIDDTRLKRGEDILVVGYPRGGPSWIAHLVSLLMAGEKEYDKVWATPLEERMVYLEYMAEGKSTSGVDERMSRTVPRICRSCLPYNFINRWIEEDNVKTIVATRNPKDILVDLYDVYTSTEEFAGSFNEFFEYAKTDPFIYGNHYEWNASWNANRENGDILFVQIEDEHHTVHYIQRVAKFLDLDLSDEFCNKILQDCSLKTLKESTATMHPLTKMGGGLDGTFEWQRWFTVAQNEWFDAKYKHLYEALKIPIDFES